VLLQHLNSIKKCIKNGNKKLQMEAQKNNIQHLIAWDVQENFFVHIIFLLVEVIVIYNEYVNINVILLAKDVTKMAK